MTSVCEITKETKKALDTFRMRTSNAEKPQAVIYEINKELVLQPAKEKATAKDVIHSDMQKEVIYSDMQELAEQLQNAPRFVLLSYPLTLDSDSGRSPVPYVMLYYLPITCSSESKMLYAGARKHVQTAAGVQSQWVIEIDSPEELETIEERLKELF